MCTDYPAGTKFSTAVHSKFSTGGSTGRGDPAVIVTLYTGYSTVRPYFTAVPVPGYSIC